jgi:hypothetical protein
MGIEYAFKYNVVKIKMVGSVIKVFSCIWLFRQTAYWFHIPASKVEMFNIYMLRTFYLLVLPCQMLSKLKILSCKANIFKKCCTPTHFKIKAW